MYLVGLALTKTLPCLAEPGKIIVVGKPDRSLLDVIPYLAALPGVISYNPEACTLTLRRRPGLITLYPEKVFITQVNDTKEGLELLDALKNAINAAWEHRDELKPKKIPKKALQHLDIYTLLPQTNCKQCGEVTCLAFAVNLILRTRLLEECIPLRDDKSYIDRRAALDVMLE